MEDNRKKVHVIPHTHWDREWYFNTSRSTVYLLKHIKEVLYTLENDHDFKTYLLDGQTSIMEDYLKYYPEDEKRIKNLIKNRRLYIGPWYTQTDQLVISQESIVRNLLYGSKKASEWGHCFKVAYVPDAFGQGGNMPQIYNSFGIYNAIFWRGVADSTFKDIQFKWEGTDGSYVYANIMRNGYNFGGEYGIPENEQAQKKYIDQFIGKIDGETNTNHIYFPYGHDQAPIRENLPKLINSFNKIDKRREYIMGDPENFFTEMLAENEGVLETFTGELTQAKHSRIHKTIFSTRADLKQLNNELENFIINTLEPTMVIGSSIGLEYPHSQLELIWKKMFENAAHDSIGGCNSDSTNRDILYRYKQVKDLSENLLDVSMRTISSRIDFGKDLNIVVFNPLPYKFKGVIELSAYVPNLEFSIYNTSNDEECNYVIEEAKELTEYVLKQTIKIDSSKDIYIPKKVYKVRLKVFINEIRPLGYCSLYINEYKKPSSSNIYLKSEKNHIENDLFKIVINENNTIDIFDKKNNQVYKNQMILVDSGDDGDSYNFSPPREDLIINSINSKREELKIIENELNQRVDLLISLKVPYNLEERAEAKKTKDLQVRITIDLEKKSEIIKFKVDVDNTVLSHKFCVQFDTKIKSEYSYSDNIFGPMKRKVLLDEVNIWEKEKWTEKPISIEPMQSYVSLATKDKIFSLITEGVREYEIIGEKHSVIQLTLFRTFAYMGKENLLFRPGRASGETIEETPDAQLLGPISCRFAVYINSEKSKDEVNLSRISKEYLTKIPSYQMSDFLNGRMIFSQKRQVKSLPLTYSLGGFNCDEIGISAIKKSEDDKSYLVRIFNPFMGRTVEIPRELIDRYQVKLDESKTDKKVTKLSYNEFITIRI